MHGPIHPTAAGIEAWARTPGARDPVEDWALIVATSGHGLLLVRLVADVTCVRHDELLDMLYVYAGQVGRPVRGPGAAEAAALREAIDLARSIGASRRVRDELTTWAGRAAAMLARRGPDPRSGAPPREYRFWFAGGWRESPP